MSAQRATKKKKKCSFDSSDDEYFDMEIDKHFDAAPIIIQNIAVDDVDMQPNLRTVGKSASFKEDDEMVMN